MSGIAMGEVTVIVPTKNEAANIGRFLSSLPRAIRLVVVDSSTDSTPTLVERLRRERTTVVRADATIPVARQLGAELARTPWLLFTDADVAFSPTYFERLARSHVPAGTCGVVGVKRSAGGYDAYHRWFVAGQTALMAVGIPAASGSNMLVDRGALARVGGFDPSLTANEDTEVMFRLARHGPVVFRRDLVVAAFDHRRLDRGVARKVFHGAYRNAALYLGLWPTRIRAGDGGYWPATDPPTSASRLRA